MSDQQLAFRAIADFGHRWRLARDARDRRRFRGRRDRVDARMAIALTMAALAPQRDAYTIPYGPGFAKPRGRP